MMNLPTEMEHEGTYIQRTPSHITPEAPNMLCPMTTPVASLVWVTSQSSVRGPIPSPARVRAGASRLHRLTRAHGADTYGKDRQ